MKVRVILELREPFDEQVGLLVTDLTQAAAEGEQHLDELLVALPARIRRIFRQSVVARAERRNPPEPGSIEGSPAPNGVAVAGESSTDPRAGRPLGTFSEPSACPGFTQRRRELGLSRSDVAAAARALGFEISKSTIGNLEGGAVAPRWHHAEALAAAVGLSIEDTYLLLRNESTVCHVVAL